MSYPSIKTCEHCNIEQPIELFMRKIKNKMRAINICKGCVKISNIKWKKENRDAALIQKRISYHKNKEKNQDKKNAKSRERYQQKKDEIREKVKKKYNFYNRNYRTYIQNKLKTDEVFRLKRTLKNRFRMAFQKNAKRGKVTELLGCTMEEFKIYLESKFQPGMTWENRGYRGWHIDHIKPLKLFNLFDENDLKLAWHYTNLRPLWALDNLKKSARYEEVSIVVF